MNVQETTTPTATVETEPTRNRPTFRPHVDIVETPHELLLVADLPGAKPDGIEIEFEKGTLTIHAAVEPRQAEDTRYLLREYGVGDYHRVFQIHEWIDSAAIRADYRDGVLEVHLPKSDAAKPRKIAVST